MTQTAHDPQFARGPNDALQCYTDLVNTSRAMGPYVGVVPELEAGFFRNRVEYNDFMREIVDVPVFFWSFDTAKVVLQASRTYPVESPIYLPRVTKAFCVFERPVLGAYINGEPASFSALSWGAARMMAHDSALVLRITGYMWDGRIAAPVWWSDVGADWVKTSTLNIDDTFWAEQQMLLQWILTASMFVEQDILTQSQVRAGKHTAKRVEAISHEPMCNVVALRRRLNNRHDSASDSERSVEWQCRWLVRGHWRKQYYQKAQRHVPIFIEPYVKGPDDKPMKTPSPTVFAVTR